MTAINDRGALAVYCAGGSDTWCQGIEGSGHLNARPRQSRTITQSTAPDHQGEFHSCQDFRKFAAWYGARLGMPEDLEDRFRRFESAAAFDALVEEFRERHGTRINPRATIEVKVPNGPCELW